MKSDSIQVTEVDYQRLKNLIENTDSEDLSQLDLELDIASLIKNDEVPADLVTMNSKVRVLNTTDQKEMTIEIVYPNQADSKLSKISIFAPLATALLGLRVNQDINWKFPDGKTRNIKVLEVLYQPEANGDWHL